MIEYENNLNETKDIYLLSLNNENNIPNKTNVNSNTY